MTDKKPWNQDSIGRLLRLAGPRPTAPQERERRVRDEVHAHWVEMLRARRRRRWLVRGSGLLAASLLVVAGLALKQEVVPVAPPFEGTVAIVEAVNGPVYVERADGSERSEVRPGDPLEAGDSVDTGILGRVALRLTSGSALRLDHRTRLEGLTDVAVALHSGALYFDSGGESRPPVEVHTPLGVVQDIGTQYELRLIDEEARVRVREGSVHLDQEGRIFDAGRGIELVVDSTGRMTRRSVPIFGPDWDWVLAVAPAFELEGRSLDSFLSWVTRETGWSPAFSDPETATSAADVVLHGSITGMRPDQALDAVLPTCGLAHRLEGGILRIEAEGP